MREGQLDELCKKLGLSAIKASHELRDKREYELSSQLLRSATSVGANVSESAYGQSRADFVSKMQIALKECSETLWRLELLEEGGLFSDSDMFDTATSIKRILIASIKTATANGKK